MSITQKNNAVIKEITEWFLPEAVFKFRADLHFKAGTGIIKEGIINPESLLFFVWVVDPDILSQVYSVTNHEGMWEIRVFNIGDANMFNLKRVFSRIFDFQTIDPDAPFELIIVDINGERL